MSLRRILNWQKRRRAIGAQTRNNAQTRGGTQTAGCYGERRGKEGSEGGEEGPRGSQHKSLFCGTVVICVIQFELNALCLHRHETSRTDVNYLLGMVTSSKMSI